MIVPMTTKAMGPYSGRGRGEGGGGGLAGGGGGGLE